MDEAQINCSKCGAPIYVNHAHPVRYGKNEEVKQLLCDRCCPNCFGGEGDGPPQSQRSPAWAGTSPGQGATVSMEARYNQNLGRTTLSAQPTDGGDINIPS